MEGNIPACIFALPLLQTLHLSGNGFRGMLPNYYSPSLVDLSVGHNFLTGSLPQSLQARGLQNLDVSVNKLRGEIINFKFNNSESIISMSLNRFSGSLPDNLRKLKRVDILEGNLFQCSTTTTKTSQGVLSISLPIYDPFAQRYSCGSTSFDNAIIFYGIFVVLVLMLSILFILFADPSINRNLVKLSDYADILHGSISFINDEKAEDQTLPPSAANGMHLSRSKQLSSEANPLAKNIKFWGGTSIENQVAGGARHPKQKIISAEEAYPHLFTNMFNLTEKLREIRYYGLAFGIVFVLILLIVYGVLNFYFATHDESYGWTVSLAYLSGQTPTIVLVMVFAFLSTIVVGLGMLLEKKQKEGLETRANAMSLKSSPASLINKENYELAYQQGDLLLASAGNRKWGWRCENRIKNKSKEYEEAIEHYEKALQLFRGHFDDKSIKSAIIQAKLMELIGNSAAKIKQTVKAKETFKNAKDLLSEHIEVEKKEASKTANVRFFELLDKEDEYVHASILYLRIKKGTANLKLTEVQKFIINFIQFMRIFSILVINFLVLFILNLVYVFIVLNYDLKTQNAATYLLGN